MLLRNRRHQFSARLPVFLHLCPVKTTIGRTMRFRSAEHVVAELAYWHEKGVS